MNMSRTTVIQTKNLSHVYGTGTPFEKKALHEINMEIQSGEFVGIIGHTGSGKSTLIQHFNGLLKPSSGQILVDGHDIWHTSRKKNFREVRFRVGLVFQYPEHQLFEETVFADISFGPKNMGLSPTEIHFRVEEAMAVVGLEDSYQQKNPFDLSGGEKRRVAIAGVLAMRPKILILDEPTAGLDPAGRTYILAQLAQYQKKIGNTILLVSHSMEDIAKYATKVLVLNQSKIFAFDTVQTIFKQAVALQKIGLAVPQITRVCNQLQQKGCAISSSNYTVKQAEEEIATWLLKKGRHHA